MNVLRKWVRAHREDPAHSFPGHGQPTLEDGEVTRLRCEVARLKMERDILKKAAAYLAKESGEVWLRGEERPRSAVRVKPPARST